MVVTVRVTTVSATTVGCMSSHPCIRVLTISVGVHGCRQGVVSFHVYMFWRSGVVHSCVLTRGEPSEEAPSMLSFTCRQCRLSSFHCGPVPMSHRHRARFFLVPVSYCCRARFSSAILELVCSRASCRLSSSLFPSWKVVLVRSKELGLADSSLIDIRW